MIGIGAGNGQRHYEQTEVFRHTDLPVAVTCRNCVSDILVACMQIGDETVARIDVRTDFEVATMFAINQAKQIGYCVRILDVAGSIAQLSIQFARVGAGKTGHASESIVRIDVANSANVVADPVR